MDPCAWCEHWYFFQFGGKSGYFPKDIVEEVHIFDSSPSFVVAADVLVSQPQTVQNKYPISLSFCGGTLFPFLIQSSCSC